MLKKLFLTTLALSLILVSVGCSIQSAREVQLKTAAGRIGVSIQAELDKLDLDLTYIAAQLSRTGLSGDKATSLLDGLAAKYPFIIDTCTTDTAGKMVAVAPQAYRNYEGTDISTQDITVKFMETKKPLLSDMFPAVEGMNAVVIMQPVLSQNGDLMGSVSALFEPDSLIGPVAEPTLKNTNMELNVSQLDGLNIYDSQGGELGLNLFTDPSFQAYPELVALGHRMVAEKSGSGTYTFVDHQSGQTMQKQAYWTTVSLHDTDWRIFTVAVIQ